MTFLHSELNCYYLDVSMKSPPVSPRHNLQGSSRTTGGIIRGRALGNAYNHADTSDLRLELDLSLAIPGKVYLYDVIADSSSFDLATVKPSRILKIDASPTLAPVLTKLARKYSPVRSTFSFLFF